MGAFFSVWSQQDAKLQQFTFKEVLGSHPETKSLFALLTTENGENAVLLCDRNPLPADASSWNEILKSSRVECLSQADKYGNLRMFLPEQYCDVKATLIYPANDFDISKYTHQKRYVVRETAKMYYDSVLPFLKEHQPSTEWVDEILQRKAEADRMIFEDSDPLTGFMLLPDLKWDGLNCENLYLQAIAWRKDLRSVRDLTDEHLPLLISIRNKSFEAIRLKYGLSEYEVRAYVHYHPTFYHFHVHFIAASFNAPGSQAGKAFLLDDVIRNIQVTPNFYQKATVTFLIGANEPVFKVFKTFYPELRAVAESS